MTSHTATALATTVGRRAPHAGLPLRERRAVAYCDVWDLVAPGEPCPACENSFEDRLARARAASR